MSNAANILLVDDEPGMLRYIRTLLEVDEYKVETASSGEEAVERVHKGLQPDLVLLDVLMPGIDGLQTLEQLRQLQPSVKVVMLSCVNDTRKVVQAMRLGAHDYLTKPFQKAELDVVIDQCLGATQQTYAGEVEELCDDVFFVAASPAMRKIRSQAALVANVDIPVLLLGESGTGKEVLARLIHKLSQRAHRTFLKVNCAAVPGDLLESELFGYEAGAFTGATHPKPGKFEICNKGTILLDEIGEMPPLLQAKLLHVLQDQQFSRLGSRSVIKVDVRILAATNINIPEALATKRLREDLYYRLNAFTLQIPPLRERKEEVPILLKHFMSRMSERFARSPLPLTQVLLGACQEYAWPGNLRELSNFVKRYLILGDEKLAVAELNPKNDNNGGAHGEYGAKLSGDQAGGLKSLARSAKDEAEAEAITKALEETNWNRKQAAALLQISYKALLYKIRQYGIAQSKSHHKLTAGA
ncbi:MAG: sigma-54-dependent Fis family transcriptional regulator [Acidobacteria bacterium]|nr:MAG: sigma-54-dependent Fis family transcriptional regulator [Acidobacteriota bacterium]HLB90563.1 sigma-54 dependent transcriptional regulator [Terriglobales bacterium]